MGQDIVGFVGVIQGVIIRYRMIDGNSFGGQESKQLGNSKKKT